MNRPCRERMVIEFREIQLKERIVGHTEVTCFSPVQRGWSGWNSVHVGINTGTRLNSGMSRLDEVLWRMESWYRTMVREMIFSVNAIFMHAILYTDVPLQMRISGLINFQSSLWHCWPSVRILESTLLTIRCSMSSLNQVAHHLEIISRLLKIFLSV